MDTLVEDAEIVRKCKTEKPDDYQNGYSFGVPILQSLPTNQQTPNWVFCQNTANNSTKRGNSPNCQGETTVIAYSYRIRSYHIVCKEITASVSIMGSGIQKIPAPDFQAADYKNLLEIITGCFLVKINLVDAFAKFNNVLYNVNLKKRQRDLFLKESIRYFFNNFRKRRVQPFLNFKMANKIM